MDYMKRSQHQQNVDKFMRLAKQVVPISPTIPPPEIRMLRARLIMEEAIETVAGLGVDMTFKSSPEPACFADIEFEDNGNPDLIEIVDGCADISVVTTGTLSACGVADCSVLETVDENNLMKFGPGGYEDPVTKKWIKPPNHKKPNIGWLLDQQARPHRT